MKIWATILAAGAILAFAAPVGYAATSVNTGRSAGPGSVLHGTVPSKLFAASDPLRGQHQFLAQVDQPRSVAAAALQNRLARIPANGARVSWSVWGGLVVIVGDLARVLW